VGEIRPLGESETFPLDDVFVELTVVEEIHRPSARDEMYGLMDAALRRQRAVFPDADGNDEAAELPPAPGERPAQKELRVVKPEELLKPGVRAIVSGAPGCGKTTLLRWLANQTLKADSRLPIFIELKLVKETAFDGDKTLEDVLYDAVGVQFLNAGGRLSDAACTAFRFHLNEKLRTGEVAIFLDGLDEIRERKIFDPLRAATEAFLASAAKDAGLVVSTRPYAVAKGFASGLEEMEIAPLDAKQIEAFLTRYFGDHADATARLRERLQRERPLADLARIPFLLGAMAGLFARGGGTATERLTLYGEIVRNLAGTLDKEKGVERFRVDDPDGETKREFLEEFACARLFDVQEADVARRLMFTGEDLKKFARRHCAARSYLATVNPNLLAADATATPLLREAGTDAYAFAHLTLQEYLAAVGLMRRADAKETLCKAIFNPTLAAMEVLPMALGLAERPDELYAALEELPESLDFVNLRVRARGLDYVGATLPPARIDALAERFMQFLHQKIAEESPYRDAVMKSFFNAARRAQRALTDRLLAALRDTNWYVRLYAAQALGRLGAGTPDVVSGLLAALRDDDGGVRQRAAEALVKLGAGTPDVTGGLLAALRDHDENVRQEAAEALGRLGAASPDVTAGLLAALRDDDEDVRRKAAQALGQLGAATPDVIAGLLAALRDDDQFVRRNAAQALGKLGAASPDVTGGLLAALRDTNQVVRQEAALALGRLGAASPDVTGGLLAAMRDDDEYVQYYAAQALGRLGAASPDVTAGLLAALRDDDEEWVRQDAAQALGRLGAASPNVTGGLLAALRDDDEDVRYYAAQALGWLGAASPDVTGGLLAALRDDDWNVRQEAALALGWLGAATPDVTGGLLAALRDKDWEVRRYAAQALGRLGAASSDVTAGLLAALRDKDSAVRREAAQALGRLGAATPDVTGGLLAALRDKDWEVRRYAAEALGQLGAATPDAVSGLLAALRDTDQGVRLYAAQALGRLGAATPDVTAFWIAALRDDNSGVRWKAAQTLGRLGAASPDVTGGLLAALRDDKDEWVRRKAAQALERITEQSPTVFLDGLGLALKGDDFNARHIPARIIGYYTDDPEILRTLAHLASAGPTDELRTIARDSVARYTRKLILFGKEFQAVELREDVARAMSLEETRGFMAHEFRSALIPVAGYAKMLGDAFREADIHNDKITRYIERIIAQSQSALALVNQYVDFSRPLVPKLENVNVSALLQELLHEMHPDWERNGITISSDIPETVLAMADRPMLAQALRNILRNALEAMERNAPDAPKIVCVSVRRREERVILSIKDSGPGVKTEHLARLFDLGFTTKLDRQGSGVGLALVRRLIREGSRGDISIENNLEGAGATATISLAVAEEKRNGA
jgi:HEAT repeat protein